MFNLLKKNSIPEGIKVHVIYTYKLYVELQQIFL